jgi:hypothetical protein
MKHIFAIAIFGILILSSSVMGQSASTLVRQDIGNGYAGGSFLIDPNGRACGGTANPLIVAGTLTILPATDPNQLGSASAANQTQAKNQALIDANAILSQAKLIYAQSMTDANAILTAALALTTAAKDGDYIIDANRVAFTNYIDANKTIPVLFGVPFQAGDIGFTVISNGWPIRIGSIGDPNNWPLAQVAGLKIKANPTDVWHLFCADANANAGLMIEKRRNP